MEPAIDDYDLGGGRLEAFYTEDPGPAMAIQIGLDEPARQMRELEAYGYCVRPPRRDRFCLRPRSMREVDGLSVAAIRRVVDRMRPEWVEEVREACRMSPDPRWIAAWCELRVEVVMAALLNLRERGELVTADE